MKNINEPFKSRFESAYQKDATSHCWNWTRPLDSGYGRFWFEGKTKLAHRISYEIYVGPIPTGLQIDHLCRNRSCVNPMHLEPVSLAVNVLRGIGITADNARKIKCKRGHPLCGENLRINVNGNRECKECQRDRVRQWRLRQTAA